MAETALTQVRAALQNHLVHAVLSNDRTAREYGLRAADLQALHLMVLREDVRTPQQISSVTGTPASTVTKLVDRLESAGYVRRIHDPNDRRRTQLELIDNAITPLQERYRRIDAWFEEVGEKFTEEELTVVIRFLDLVSEYYANKFL